MKKTIIAMAAALILTGCNEPDEAKVGIEPSLEFTEPSDGIVEVLIPVKITKNDIGDFNLTVKLISQGGSLTQATIGDDFEINQYEYTIKNSDDEQGLKLVIHSDDIYEGSENIQLEISTDNEYVEISESTSIITIINSTQEPTISFPTVRKTVTEGAGKVDILVNLSNPAQGVDVEIPFTVTGIAAREVDGVGDFYLSADSFVITAGETTSSIYLEVKEDPIKEGGESIIITLESPTSFSVGENNVISILIPGENTLNDTGVVLNSNGSLFDAAEYNDYPNQDASYGLDTTETDSFDGKSGFSFTKIDEAGNPMNSDRTDHRCTYDERTSLFWEVKQGEEVLPFALDFTKLITDAVEASEKPTDDSEYVPYPYHEQHRFWKSKSYSYYWTNTNPEENGGSPGATGAGFPVGSYPITQTCAFPNIKMVNYSSDIKGCTSEDYVKYFNLLGVCGFKDWKLPKLDQLRTIVNYNEGDNKFDTKYFPNTANTRYLSATPHADATAAAWCIDANDGLAKMCNKQLPYAIRLVRSFND